MALRIGRRQEEVLSNGNGTPSGGGGGGRAGPPRLAMPDASQDGDNRSLPAIWQGLASRLQRSERRPGPAVARRAQGPSQLHRCIPGSPLTHDEQQTREPPKRARSKRTGCCGVAGSGRFRHRIEGASDRTDGAPCQLRRRCGRRAAAAGPMPLRRLQASHSCLFLLVTGSPRTDRCCSRHAARSCAAASPGRCSRSLRRSPPRRPAAHRSLHPMAHPTAL